ncbi:MAG: biotin/lipoyl-binding protein [Bacteroidetes bacterium]|nr:biotin/lipoyl-binding protein [Bacteroidota bacterium]
MAYEVKINDKLAKVELRTRVSNNVEIFIDGQKYDADVVMVERGVYSIILNGISYNVELIENGSSKNYLVNTLYDSFEIEVIDAESKYLKSRLKDLGDDSKVISTPMPGKVVKVLVKPGDNVKAGDTVIIISAMKMESEYKVKKDRIIKEVLVKEGDIVDGHQALIVIE